MTRKTHSDSVKINQVVFVNMLWKSSGVLQVQDAGEASYGSLLPNTKDSESHVMFDRVLLNCGKAAVLVAPG